MSPLLDRHCFLQVPFPLPIAQRSELTLTSSVGVLSGVVNQKTKKPNTLSRLSRGKKSQHNSNSQNSQNHQLNFLLPAFLPCLRHNKWKEEKRQPPRNEKLRSEHVVLHQELLAMYACEAQKSFSPSSCKPSLLQGAFLPPKEVITGEES
ncbi:hypothetical protein CapIbe_017599 [Capra ibex]